MEEIHGKIALVTGASRGIGQAILLSLGQAGAFVIGTATSSHGAEQITHTIHEANIQGIGMCMDVTDTHSVESTLAAIAQYGELAILVNNAGITRDTLALRMSDADWDAVIETNLSSVFRLSRAVLRPMMKARYGRIVNISSIVGYTGNSGQVNYCAAKAGIAGLSKAMAQECASRGITINCVAPGFINTDMTSHLNENIKQKMLERIPLNRFGKPEEIADATLFLIRSSYITGETIHVNGGMFMA